MKKSIVFLIGILVAFSASAQNVEMISGKSDKKVQKVNKNFEWISPKTNLDSVDQLGVFRMLLEAEGTNGIDMSFYNLRAQAQKLGANTYKIAKIEPDGQKLIVVVNVYYMNRSQMEKNIEHYEREYITLIGNINTESSMPHTYYINDEIEEIEPFSYKKIASKKGSMLRISIKKDSDVPMSIYGKQNNLGEFITQGDADLGIPVELKLGQAAHSITIKRKLKTNGMIYLKMGFARFAIDILDFITENKHPF